MNPDNNSHCGPTRPTIFGVVGLFLAVTRVFMASNDLVGPCGNKRWGDSPKPPKGACSR